MSGGALRLATLAQARGLSPDLLRRLGWAERPDGVAIPWPTTDGRPAWHLRHTLEKDGGRKRWAWAGYDRATILPYGADRLERMCQKAPEVIVVVESETDAVALWTAGLPAIATGGADGWQGRWWGLLQGFGRVVVWLEDAGGLSLLRRLLETRPTGGPEVRVCHGLGQPGKDPGRILAARNGGGRAIVRQVVERAVPVEPVPDLLQAVVERLRAKRQPGGAYSARCPFHDDRHPSLSLFKGDDGARAFRCHSGRCGAAGPLALLGACLGLVEEPGVPASPLFATTHTSSSSSSSSLNVSEFSEDDEDWRPLPLGTLRERYRAGVTWLVEGYIALGELTLVPGPPESFTSWAMVDLARAVLTGDRWLGRFPVPRGLVVYIEQERAQNLVYQTDLLEKATGADLSGLLVLPPCGFTVTLPDWRHRLQALVQEVRPRLIVINSFRAVFRGRSSDGTEIHEALGWLGRLAEDSGAAIVVVDQVNKVGGLGLARGMAAHADSLQKEYEADAVLHIERDRDEVGRGTGPARVYIGKRRAGEAGRPFAFDLEPVGEGVRPLYRDEVPVERQAPPTASERVLAALREAGRPLSPKEVADQAGLALGTVYNTLAALERAGRAARVQRGLWAASSSSSLNSLTFSENEDDEDQESPPGAVAAAEAGRSAEVFAATTKRDTGSCSNCSNAGAVAEAPPPCEKSPPDRPCYACKGRAFWWRPAGSSGDWLCAACHPPPGP